MLRSVALVIIVGVSQLGCCCCGDFMKGFNKGFNQGLQNAQRQAEEEQRRAKQGDDAKRKADLQALVAKNLGPNNSGGSLAPGSPFWAKLKQTIDQRQYVTNKTIGGGMDKPFSDVHPDGGVLVGFFAGADDGGQVIAFLQPIYLTSQGEKVGQAYGKPHGPVQVLKAKPGYAVGGANLRVGMFIDAITVKFMKVEGERLNLADSYTSIQVGGQGGGPQSFTSTGTFLVGIHGKQNDNDNFSSLGFYSLP